MDVDGCKGDVVVNTTLAVPVGDRCCPPLLTAVLDEHASQDLATAFKALADPVRLRLLSLIANAPDGTACSCDLEGPVGKSQPTVSHHLAVLAEAGMITKVKAGRWVICSVVPERLAALRAALDTSTVNLLAVR
jgi:ArsR family transcriptional regulator, arsenate/arsenite/antimonite-responsive transcriptional repressor